mmetsp:Transcript_25326/g.39225  ORF Transcript_25326/g.39225 Transcript_25326/m.39225 type:complete len:214 (+) Transcript_25326:2085-2726(+)
MRRLRVKPVASAATTLPAITKLSPIAYVDRKPIQRDPSDLSMYETPVRKKAHKRKGKKKSKKSNVQTGKVSFLDNGRRGRSHNDSTSFNRTQLISQSPGHKSDLRKNNTFLPKTLYFHAIQESSQRRGVGDDKSERGYARAAKRIQCAIRGKLGRLYFKRLKRRRLFQIAASSGVFLACEGTVQGGSGWYQQTEESAPVLYEVDEFGQWKLIM